MLSVRALLPGIDAGVIGSLELKCYDEPWEISKFAAFGYESVVGLADGRVICYYCLKGSKLLRFGVSPSWRRMGVGTRLISEIKRTVKLTTIIPETDDGAALFLRSVNFKCVNTIPKAFRLFGQPVPGLFFLWKPEYESV